MTTSRAPEHPVRRLPSRKQSRWPLHRLGMLRLRATRSMPKRSAPRRRFQAASLIGKGAAARHRHQRDLRPQTTRRLIRDESPTDGAIST